MKPFVGTILIGCSLLSGVIFWADPGHRWHRKPVFAARSIQRGEVWVFPQEAFSPVDMRFLKLLHMASFERAPDYMLLGSSRGHEIRERIFPAGSRLFNSSVDGASIEDYVVFWQAAKDMEKIPGHVVLMVDPWQFNQNWWSGFWIVNANYVEQFEPGRFSLAEKEENLAANLREFFSFDGLRSAVHYGLIRLRNPRTDQGHIVSEGFIPKGHAVLRSDGTVGANSLQPSPTYSTEQLRLDAAKFVMRNGVFDNFRDWRFDENAADLTRRLILDISRQTHVTVVAAPFPVVTLQAFVGRARFEAGMADFKHLMIALQASTPATFCDATDPSVSGCSDHEFADPVHPNEACLYKVLQHCLALPVSKIN